MLEALPGESESYPGNHSLSAPHLELYADSFEGINKLLKEQPKNGAA